MENISKPIHLLHIGKTGGTSLKYAFKTTDIFRKGVLRIHNHKTRLKDIPIGERVVFFLRDPVSRFVSGFYSRKRMGKPRYNSTWNDFEKELFSVFKTPDDLTSSLVERLSHSHDIARESFIKIQHLRSVTYWLSDINYIESRKNDILFIGFQEEFNNCFEELKKILMLPKSICLPGDSINSHRSPGNLKKKLSIKNSKFLKEFYIDDYKIYEYCKKLVY